MLFRSAGRFRIVFKPTAPLPVSFTAISAYQQAGNISVEWKVSNPFNIEKYEVVRSSDGINFNKVAEQKASGINGSDAGYFWLDMNPLAGDNFYRIRSIGQGGDIKYSSMVKVTMKNGAEAISVFPNPLNGNNFSLQLTNMPKGMYTITLSNKMGQIVHTENFQHGGGSVSVLVELKHHIPAGIYDLRVSGTGGMISSRIVKK